MPRVIQFPPHEDGRLGQAWAAFAAEDAKASAPAGLEARVMRAAQAALAEKRRAEAERRRHHWIAGLSALAASVLAATAWWLAGSGAVAVNDPNPAPMSAAPATASAAPAADVSEGSGSRPVPMTNVEAGRVLAGGPRMLAARPLFEPVDSGAVRAATVPRAKSFSAPLVVPAPIPLNAANVSAPTADPGDEATAEPGPYGITSPDDKKTGHEVWTSRGFVFDPASGQHAPTAPPQKKKDEATPPPPNF